LHRKMRAPRYAPYAARICLTASESSEENQMNLKSMSIDRLTGLRARVEAALNSKLLISDGLLNPNSQSSIGSTTVKAVQISGAVARNIATRRIQQRLGGRGLRPKWLTAAIKAESRPTIFLSQVRCRQESDQA